MLSLLMVVFDHRTRKYHIVSSIDTDDGAVAVWCGDHGGHRVELLPQTRCDLCPACTNAIHGGAHA